MHPLIRNSLISLGVACLVAGCGAEVSGGLDVDADAGTADFSNFVAIGDSLTAGYADNALYRQGQVNSYPAILAQQFALVGGGSFTQPLMPVEATGSLTLAATSLVGLSDRLVLVPTGNPPPARPAAPSAITPTVSTEIGVPLTGVFNNLGVPGAKSYHLGAPSYGDATGVLGGTANPYFVRFRSADTTSVVADAAVQAPTFFVLWIGNNDILTYATGGGTGTDQTGNIDPTSYAGNDITDPTTLANIVNGVLATINTPTNKGVLINIPDVSTIPYFTTVTYNPIPMDAATAAFANGAYAGYNGGGAGLLLTGPEIAQRTIVFSESLTNALVIEDESLTDLTGFGLPSIRQATAADLIVLPASAKIGTELTMGDPATVWGVGTALLDADVLTESEVTLVVAAQTAYNVAIKAAADADPTIAFFDAAAKVAELSDTGINYGSGGISSTFAQGGAFSLDGVHPTARGYAVIANEIIKVIEADFGASIPPVDPGQYPTVFYE